MLLLLLLLLLCTKAVLVGYYNFIKSQKKLQQVLKAN